MAGMVFWGAMAAFGALSILWTILGWLLPRETGGIIVCLDAPELPLRLRIRWLRSLGLLRLPLVVVTHTPHQNDDLEYCSREQLLTRLEQERNFFHGTGNGDPSGDHRRGGLPEL